MKTVSPSLVAPMVLVLLLIGCGSGGSGGSANNTPPYVPDATPADAAAIPDAAAILKYLAALSRGDLSGTVVGQNTGHGNQILNATGPVGYAPLIGTLESLTGEAPGILSLDYEHDQIFSAAQLSAANQVLIAYWQNGGLVTINWSAQNPWWNDESDIANNPGIWTNTRVTGGNMALVNMADLTNPASSVYPVWRAKLDRIAAALQELQTAGVVVLWRPMQEMNGSWFWWGNYTTHNASGYVAVWRDMFQYFTQVKGLHNLLWVYSPNPNGFGVEQVAWAYPGDAYVDIVAATTYSDTLTIADYSSYQSFNKVLGMGEFGSRIGGSHALNGTFDNRSYVTRLQQNYPAIAYWVSWSDWELGGGQFEYHAIATNAHATELMQDPQAITRSRLGWQAFR